MGVQYPIVLTNAQMQQLQSGDIADIGYPIFGLKNKLINNDFRINQRGGSTYTAANEAIFDMWRTGSDGTLGVRTCSRQTLFADAALPWGIRSYLNVLQPFAGTSQTFNRLSNRVEFADTFAGETVTFSFYAKADGSRTLSAGMLQNFGTGGSPSSVVTQTSQNFQTSTSWQRFQFQFTLPSVNGKTLGSNGDDFVACYIDMPINSTYSFDITAAQLEIGPVATQYEFIENQLLRALSGRHVRAVSVTLNAIANSTTQVVGFWAPGTVTMRATPTATLSTTSPIFRFPTVGDFTGSGSAITAYDGSGNGGAITINGFTGMTAGRGGFLTSGSITLDAQI